MVKYLTHKRKKITFIIVRYVIIQWEIISTVKTNFLNLKLTEQQKLQEKKKLRKLLCGLWHKNKTIPGSNYG